jgi:hypothetical protein
MKRYLIDLGTVEPYVEPYYVGCEGNSGPKKYKNI